MIKVLDTVLKIIPYNDTNILSVDWMAFHPAAVLLVVSDQEA